MSSSQLVDDDDDDDDGSANDDVTIFQGVPGTAGMSGNPGLRGVPGVKVSQIAKHHKLTGLFAAADDDDDGDGITDMNEPTNDEDADQ